MPTSRVRPCDADRRGHGLRTEAYRMSESWTSEPSTASARSSSASRWWTPSPGSRSSRLAPMSRSAGAPTASPTGWPRRSSPFLVPLITLDIVGLSAAIPAVRAAAGPPRGGATRLALESGPEDKLPGQKVGRLGLEPRTHGLKVGRLGAKSVLPARMPHADARKAHIAQACCRYSSHESSHGIPGRAPRVRHSK
jgi:hypothetical protein